MAKFYYHSIKEMEPKPGVRYKTTYFKQNRDEYQRVLEHVQMVCKEILDLYMEKPEWERWAEQPLPGFPRTQRQPNYSLNQMLTDMLEQLIKGKDVPSGMLGRWARLFEGTDYAIELIEGARPHIDSDVWTDIFNPNAGKQ